MNEKELWEAIQLLRKRLTGVVASEARRAESKLREASESLARVTAARRAGRMAEVATHLDAAADRVSMAEDVIIRSLPKRGPRPTPGPLPSPVPGAVAPQVGPAPSPGVVLPGFQPLSTLPPGGAWRNAQARLREMKKEVTRLAAAGDVEGAAKMKRAAEEMEKLTLSLMPVMRRTVAGVAAMVRAHPYLGAMGVIGTVFGVTAKLWAFYSGKETGFPAFIFEESSQQASGNLWGFTDKATLARIMDPRITVYAGPPIDYDTMKISPVSLADPRSMISLLDRMRKESWSEFEVWLYGAKTMMLLLEVIADAQDAYIQSTAFRIAPLQILSYEAFARSTRAKLASNEFIIREALFVRGEAAAGRVSGTPLGFTVRAEAESVERAVMSLIGPLGSARDLVRAGQFAAAATTVSEAEELLRQAVDLFHRFEADLRLLPGTHEALSASIQGNTATIAALRRQIEAEVAGGETTATYYGGR